MNICHCLQDDYDGGMALGEEDSFSVAQLLRPSGGGSDFTLPPLGKGAKGAQNHIITKIWLNWYLNCSC